MTRYLCAACQLLGVSALAAGAAHAQPPDPGQRSDAPVVAFRVAAGYQSFALRDIASTRPPVDASQVRWVGSGPTVVAEYERARPLRLHSVAVAVTTSGGFVYETGVDSSARPPDDSVRLVEGRYDYHRTLTRSLGVRGLQPEIGVRGVGERRTLRRGFGGGVVVTESDLVGSGAFVAGLRYRRGDRCTAWGEWTNGTALAHGSQHHSSDVDVEQSGVAVGWLSDIAAHFDVRITTRALLVFSYLRRGEALLFDHRSYTDEQRRFTIGMTYAR